MYKTFPANKIKKVHTSNLKESKKIEKPKLKEFFKKQMDKYYFPPNGRK